MATVIVEPAVAPSRQVAVAADASASAVSWAAVLAGAAVIAAIQLILLALGAGFGLSSVSPWPSAGVSITTFTVMTAVWFVVMQWISAGFGGYVAGRLRTRWTGLHTTESYFRDTAHGILAWATAVVATAAFLAGAASLLAGGATTGASQGAAQNIGASNTNAYFADTMFRSEQPNAGANAADPRPEATRIITRAVAPGGDVSGPDRTYLARLVAARTGLSQDEAQKRVDDAITNARQAADKARKATMQAALFAGFALLIGAFIAAVTGRIGGNHRDHLAAL